MDGATGTALEWALALLRAPAERHRLRQRPLPAGVAELLTVAANVTPEAVDTAAAQLGETAETLREAARFYAREVLFHADADAYRTLGVEPDALAAQIKAHHRLLQIWLHPDRQHGGDDSVFAARVNTAWNQLRSGERRRAYDGERAVAATTAESGWAQPAAEGGAPSLPAGVWHPAPVPGPAFTRRRHRALVVGLLGVCLLLGWLVIRQSEREPEPWAFDGAEAVPAAASAEPPAPKAETAPRPYRAPAAAPPVRIASAATLPAPITEPEPAFVPVETTLDAPVAESAPAVPAPRRNAAIAATAPPAAPPPVQRSAPPRVSRAARTPVVVAAAAPVPAPRVPEAAATAAGAPVVRPPEAGAAAEAPPPAGDSLFGRLRRALTRRSDAGAAPELGVEGDVAFNRIQQARQVGQQLLRYLAADSQPAPPPIWNSAATLSRADGLRRDLRRGGPARLGAPQWRIGQTAASLRSDYSVAGVTQGTLSAAVIWREDRWLVTSIDLEYAP